jgi:hypothetical protein
VITTEFQFSDSDTKLKCVNIAKEPSKQSSGDDVFYYTYVVQFSIQCYLQAKLNEVKMNQ